MNLQFHLVLLNITFYIFGIMPDSIQGSLIVKDNFKFY